MRTHLRTLALFTSFAFCAFPIAPGAADTVTLSPRIFPVGKWAEGIVVAPGGLWVAESGQKSIVALDPNTGAVLRRVNVGRLPVGMTLGPDGTVDALIQTDKLVWRQPPNGNKGSALTGLEGCPDGIASDNPYLWVMTEPDCSSDSSRLIRIDPRNGGRASSPTLGQWDEALLPLPNAVWIAHARAPALSIVDRSTLSARTVDIPDASLWAISGCCGAVFVGGRLLSNDAQGIVSSIDPGTFQERRRQPVDQQVAYIASDDRSVVVVGEKGKIWVFSPGLDLQRTITLSVGAFEPRAAVIQGETLYLTQGQRQGENGAVFVVNGWRPAAPAATTLQPQPPQAPTAQCPYNVVNVNAAAVLWMYQEPDAGSTKVVGIPANATGLTSAQCTQDWCYVSFDKEKGWVARQNIAPTCN